MDATGKPASGAVTERYGDVMIVCNLRSRAH